MQIRFSTGEKSLKPNKTISWDLPRQNSNSVWEHNCRWSHWTQVSRRQLLAILKMHHLQQTNEETEAYNFVVSLSYVCNQMCCYCLFAISVWKNFCSQISTSLLLEFKRIPNGSDWCPAKVNFLFSQWFKDWSTRNEFRWFLICLLIWRHLP